MGLFRLGVSREREARPGPAEARGAARRDVGRHRVRLRLDAVHRSDPRRHPGDCRIEEHHRSKASTLLAVYSLGLGDSVSPHVARDQPVLPRPKRIRRYYHAIEVASGVLLVTIGVLILTGQLTIIVRYLQPYLPVYSADSSQSVSCQLSVSLEGDFRLKAEATTVGGGSYNGRARKLQRSD